MKKNPFDIVILHSIGSARTASPNRINGSGNLIDRTIPAPDIETVSSACGVTVLRTTTRASASKLTTTWMEYVVVEERQGTPRRRTRPRPQRRPERERPRDGHRSVQRQHPCAQGIERPQIDLPHGARRRQYSIETSSAAKVEAAQGRERSTASASSPPSTSRSAAQTRRAPRRSPFRAKPPNSGQPQPRPPSFRPTNSTPRRIDTSSGPVHCTEHSAPTPRAVRRSVTRATADPPEQIERRQIRN